MLGVLDETSHVDPSSVNCVILGVTNPTWKDTLTPSLLLLPCPSPSSRSSQPTKLGAPT